MHDNKHWTGIVNTPVEEYYMYYGLTSFNMQNQTMFTHQTAQENLTPSLPPTADF